MRIIDNSQNIFIVCARGIWRFLRTVFFAIAALLFFRKIDTIQTSYPFLEEMTEKGPDRFNAHPTGIKLGRAVFHPILFLFSQKKSHDKKS